ncbi:MAG TPA: cbb3-type cytochrome c oxidase subunit 3 [Nevskiaceae bacterium]
MTPLWGHLVGVFILLMMIGFLGIWAWAWLPHHRRVFGRLARLPMEDAERPVDHGIAPTAAEDRR